MDELKLDKIANDVQDIKLSLAKVEMTLERNTNDVEKHIRRSDLQEEQVKALKDEVLPLLPEIKTMVKYWKILSIIVIVTIAGTNPAVIPLLLKFIGVPVP